MMPALMSAWPSTQPAPRKRIWADMVFDYLVLLHVLLVVLVGVFFLVAQRG